VEPQIPYAQPLNHNVIFVKEEEIIVTRDAWYIALDINVRIYHDALSAIKSDLLAIVQVTQTGSHPRF
jgi:hypothetical protein